MIHYTINSQKKLSKISKEIYGQFSEHLGRCIYDGLYVGKNSPIPNTDGVRSDVLDALRKIRVPVLRWPGGCFADEYHWKNGIGPCETRKKMVNTNWGHTVEDNSFGTHEFFRLCELLGCEAYINGNLGSGTVAEMQEWVEYITFDGLSPMSNLRRQNGHEAPWKLPFFGVGNESWGCGGNMTPEYYANEYRRYQTFIKNYGENRVAKIACGPNGGDYAWTEALMKQAARFMDGISLHYYTVPTGVGKHKGSASEFGVDEYYDTLVRALKMEELVTKHSRIMDVYDPDKRVGLIVDEWGVWCDVEPGTNPAFLYQQNSMRDAVIAALTLNIFNKHSDRVRMANIAQMVNVLQSMILTDGAKMLVTPTYHVFDLYKAHQDAALLESGLDENKIDDKLPRITESASIAEDGRITVTMANLSESETCDIGADILGREIERAEATILTGKIDACNTFENAENVRPQTYDGCTVKNGKLQITLPPCSVLSIAVD